MRDIKFRAYTQGEMWDVIEWNFDSQAVGRQDILLRDGSGNEFRDLLKNLDLMQYTGLTDINGDAIYEGDIVTPYSHPDKWYWPVKWEELDGGFSPFAVPGEHVLTTISPSEVEVVGNMYENPELLNA